MKTILENKIEKAIVTYAETNGFIVYKFVSVNCAGVPDRIFIYNGIITFVEFKSSVGKLSPIQKHRIEELKNVGVTVEVINNIPDGMKLIERIMNETKRLPNKNGRTNKDS